MIRLKNWMRFRGEFELKLTSGAYIITAKDLQDTERSNYLGKSSLPAAIRWCLDGVQPRREKRTLDQLISDGEDSMEVILEFSNGAFISRKKKRGHSADLEVRLGTRTGRGEKSQELVNEILGISADDRLTTCWAEQGEIKSIIRLTSTKLTEQVEEWLGLENLVKAGEHAEEQFRNLYEQLEYQQRVVTQLVADGCSDGEFEELAQTVEEEAHRILGLEKKAQNLLCEWEIYNKRKHVTELIRMRNEKQLEAEELAKDLKEVKEDLKLRDDLEKARERKVLLENEWKDRKSIAQGQFGGDCPVSEFECPIKEEINKDREANQSRANSTYDDLQVQRKLVSELELKREVEKKLLWEQKLLRGRYERIKAEEKSIVDALVTLNEVALSEGDLPPETVTIDRTALNEATKELEQKRIAREKLPAAQSKLENLKHQLKEHEAAATILGPEGVRKKVVERTVEAIWREASTRLLSAGIGLSLIPMWGRETGTIESNCRRCGKAFPSSTKIKICERCGNARGMKVRHEFSTQLSDYSGAAEDLAGFGLRVAVYNWLKATKGFDWTIGLFDEPASALDPYHRRALGTHILKLLGQSFDQVFLISHTREVFTGIPNQILVMGDGKWSKIQVV